MTARIYNFSSGPAVLPLPVLEQAQRDLLSLPGVGCSALEISHRSPWFEGVLAETEQRLRKLVKIPDNYKVLFLQGGARLQFSMVPMNILRGTGKGADYVVTGSWGTMAQGEAKREGPVRTAYSSKESNFDRLPGPKELDLDPNAAYVHITSNETIQGVQFSTEPDVGGAPLVCDSSSDFLHRPLDIKKYGLLYACAQKNLGPAGVTIVIVRDDLMARADKNLPSMLNYQAYAAEKSMQNTPPVFAIYVMNLVFKWLEGTIGGLDKMLEHNRRKAKLLYDAIDSSGGFYRGHAQPAVRSLMNVTFRLPDDATQDRFLKGAEAIGLDNLKGHRSVGGMRASIYNAMPIEGVEKLRDYMREFAKKG
ncbi:MAG TPA: 3-phosphoserine/phosphohydroxythreonine transaminase [Pirellulales bacterium]|jgi:phosphoserine aminotransferase|nr:3-phosphoserine/phosphohydroxythreonine transaminase [Pirellulales bacterium]